MATKPQPQREVATPSILTVSPYSSAVAREMYPGQVGVDDQRDAARHLLAAGTLARKYGVAPAELIGKMHEWSTSPIEALKMMLGGTPTSDYLMDTRNNSVGARLGAQAKSQGELEDLVQLEAERAQVNAPEGRAMLLKPGYAKGGSVLGAKMLRSGEGLNELTKQYPELSGFLQSFGGTAPDEMGSVLDPLTARRRAGAEYGFPAGAALNLAPALGPLSKLAATGARAGARNLAVPRELSRQAGVIKMPGGNWLSGSVESGLSGLKRPTVNIRPDEELPLELRNRVLVENAPAEAMNNWIDKQLTRYVKNDMATPGDPVRALAERGVLHVDPEQVGVNRFKAPDVRRKYGQPQLGQSEAARAWEDSADTALTQTPMSEYQNFGSSNLTSTEPWLQKLDPAAPMYRLAKPTAEDTSALGFNHLIDELRNATNPESGLPAELLLKYSSLPQVSVPQAVERVAKINEWRAAQKAEADLARAQNPATQVFKEYAENNPKGLKWVELKKPDTPPEGWAQTDKGEWVNPKGLLNEKRGYDPRTSALEDALKYEGDTMGHCVGGYCPDVIEGRSRIFSLRSGKGEPHVTVEVKPANDDPLAEVFRQLPREEQLAIRERALGAENASMDNFLHGAEADANRAAVRTQMLKERPELADLNAPERIIQIKGKGNKAPNPEYLPFVQDFVKSGKWSDVGDLQNTGLVRMKGGSTNIYDGPSKYKDLTMPDAGYYTPREIADHLEAQGVPRRAARQHAGDINGLIDDLMPPEGFATGGLVDDSISGYNPARVDEIVNQLRTELFQ